MQSCLEPPFPVALQLGIRFIVNRVPVLPQTGYLFQSDQGTRFTLNRVPAQP